MRNDLYFQFDVNSYSETKLPYFKLMSTYHPPIINIIQAPTNCFVRPSVRSSVRPSIRYHSAIVSQSTG